MKEKRCGNCIYWDSEKIECHRYAPRPLKGYGEKGSWLNVNSDDWCGEHKGQTLSPADIMALNK
jgi:hypothetical protein